YGLAEGIITVVYPIQNLGLGDLIIGEITVEGEGYSVIQPALTVVPPGGTTSFSVSFDPSGLTPGSYEGEVTIPSNDRDSPCLFELIAYAGAPMVIFEQYDGPFVFPPTFSNPEKTEYYLHETAFGDNGVKYAFSP